MRPKGRNLKGGGIRKTGAADPTRIKRTALKGEGRLGQLVVSMPSQIKWKKEKFAVGIGYAKGAPQNAPRQWETWGKGKNPRMDTHRRSPRLIGKQARSLKMLCGVAAPERRKEV